MHNISVVSHLIYVRASAGNSARLGARLSTLVGPSSKAFGCLHFALQKSLTEDDLWVIHGGWADESAMNDWVAAPELKVFAELMSERLVKSLDFQTFASVATTRSACGWPTERLAG